MSRIDFSRRATIDEIALEMDRRGAVIERLESQIAELTLERNAWRSRENETQESLQKIGEEFGVYGGEPRVDGVRRVLNELRSDNKRLSEALRRGCYPEG